jgi:3-oxoacyl-[acyl-carrier-protein] synthase-3
LSALEAAKMAVEDIDLILVTSFPAEHIAVGDAAWLVNALGTRRPAMNVESTCSGALSCLQLASAMIESGQAKNILIVVACVYSKTCDWSDAHTWFLADGVAAYVVSEARDDEEGFQAFHSVSTAEACGAFEHRLENDKEGTPRSYIRANAPAGRVLRAITPRSIKDACTGVVKKAGMTLDDVDFFVPNTPVAWFHETFAETLGVPVEKTVSTYTDYANIGPVLNPVNLYRALSDKKIQAGEQVLLFSIGSVSIASAALMRAGKIALGNIVER